MVSNVSWKSVVDLANHPSAGDPLTDPYLILPGSDVGVTSPQLQADAEALFPTYDFAQPVTQMPANYKEKPTISEFLAWHSSVQTKWMDQYHAGENYTTLKTGSDTLTLVRSADTPRVIIVENLQKRDIVKLSAADQRLVALTPAFSATGGIGDRYGLAPNSQYSDLNATLTTLYDAALGTNGSNNNQTIRGNFSDSIPTATADEMKKIFEDEVKNLQTRTNGNAIISPQDIKERLDAIVKRAWRMAEFAKAHYRAQEVRTVNFFFGSFTIPKAEISLDRGTSIYNGLNNLIAQEKKMLDLDNAKLNVANSGQLRDKRLDAPTLIFIFQQYTSQVTEADVAANTEENNQLNALLKTYAAIQRLVNETQKGFNPKESGEKKGWLGAAEKDSRSYNADTDNDAVREMFNSKRGDWALDNLAHPLEVLYGVTRPEQDIVHSEKDGKIWPQNFSATWSSFGTQLSDAVNLLNQQSQIKMNDINSEQKAQNRHFDLANNALSKLYDILQNITRS